MRKVTPITEQFQHFVEGLKESFGGDLNRKAQAGLTQLQEENQRLKRLVADLTLDKTMLQDVLAKKF